MPRSVSFTSNYSDPLKAMTIKALQARQLELAEADKQRKMPEMRSPLQGAAYVADIFANSLDRNATSRAEGANRDELARLQAGIDPNKPIDAQTLASMARLDPEFGKFGFERNFSLADSLREQQAKEADALRTHDWNVDDREDDQQAARDLARQAQEATAGLQTSNQKFTGGQNDLDRGASKATADADREATRITAEANRTAAEKLQEDKQAEERLAAQQLEIRAADQRTQEAKIAQEKAISDAAITANAPQTQAAKLEADYQAGRFGPVGSPEAKAIRDDAISKETRPPPKTAQEITAKAKLSDSLTATRSTLESLKEAQALAPQVFQGRLAKYRMEAVLAAPDHFDPETVAQATATQRYFQIMDMNAVTTMSRTLSGADSNSDVARFLGILADPNSTLENKNKALQAMLDVGSAYERTQAAYVTESGGDPALSTVGGGTTAAPGGADKPPPNATTEELLKWLETH